MSAGEPRAVRGTRSREPSRALALVIARLGPSGFDRFRIEREEGYTCGVLNLKNPNLPSWPDDLRPIGEGSVDKEPFEQWWARHSTRLGHLHMQIAEQWIYRHWTYSHFSFLPLDALSWRLETWESAAITRDVVRYGHDRTPYNVEFDYKTFQRRGGDDRHATARALDEGTWNYPIVVLETPDGFIDAVQDKPDARFVLVEGHQRMRYLNALLQTGHVRLGPHQVFILRCSAAL